ncbi:MAG TPA: hypothetical protein VMP11_02875 [Verrucomicrobiae bacterium]|nr:hypothetical protein [Verrucomicrobiae bacterium]
MATELPLKQMSVREKLVAMEALWENLSRAPEAIASLQTELGKTDAARREPRPPTKRAA